MDPDKKETLLKKAADAVETPTPPQHMDPSKKPKTEKGGDKPGKKKGKK
jgi:hypothetical protein